MPVRLNGRVVDERTLRAILAFVLLYVGLFALGALLLTIDAAREGSSSARSTRSRPSATTLGNVGPGFGFAGPFGSFAVQRPLEARDDRAHVVGPARDHPGARAADAAVLARMTLAQLAVTVAVLGMLGLVAGRFGLSAIPAYLLAGLLLGPNQPTLRLRPAVGGDDLRRRARDHLPALLPRARVQLRPAAAERPPRPARRLARLRRERRDRAGRRPGRVRLLVRGPDHGRRDLRLVECGRGEGADRLQAAGRQRDRPHPRDPRVRGPGGRRSARIRGAGGGGLSRRSSPWPRRSGSSRCRSPRRARRPIDRVLARLPPEFLLLFVFAFLVGMAAVARCSGSPRRSAP